MSAKRSCEEAADGARKAAKTDSGEAFVLETAHAMGPILADYPWTGLTPLPPVAVSRKAEMMAWAVHRYSAKECVYSAAHEDGMFKGMNQRTTGWKKTRPHQTDTVEDIVSLDDVEMDAEWDPRLLYTLVALHQLASDSMVQIVLPGDDEGRDNAEELAVEFCASVCKLLAPCEPPHCD
jgi:hypothetical protein